MVKAVCDVCHREVKKPLNNLAHFCERCQPFAEQFWMERGKVIEEMAQEGNRRIESFRNKFMREIVLPERELKAVK
uniref:Uncharacterized protein n=1 Tax=viral metagenome TaxID=1070528 RepID=A0A6M3L6H6_9ZZZZ